MSDFITADVLLAKMEGGYAPDDNGQGPVNHGITLAWLRSVDPGATEETIRQLGANRARELRYEHWWVAPGWGRIENQRLATAMYITGINTGVQQAVKLLQSALNQLQAGLREDGILGPKTLAVVNVKAGRDPDWIMDLFKAKLEAHYRELGKKRPQYLNGWLSRVEAL